jgi:hypothetical protein
MSFPGPQGTGNPVRFNLGSPTKLRFTSHFGDKLGTSVMALDRVYFISNRGAQATDYLSSSAAIDNCRPGLDPGPSYAFDVDPRLCLTAAEDN